jgi:hypothetical protein
VGRRRIGEGGCRGQMAGDPAAGDRGGGEWWGRDRRRWKIEDESEGLVSGRRARPVARAGSARRVEDGGRTREEGARTEHGATPARVCADMSRARGRYGAATRVKVCRRTRPGRGGWAKTGVVTSRTTTDQADPADRGHVHR